jgi:flavoprotein
MLCDYLPRVGVIVKLTALHEIAAATCTVEGEAQASIAFAVKDMVPTFTSPSSLFLSRLVAATACTARDTLCRKLSCCLYVCPLAMSSRCQKTVSSAHEGLPIGHTNMDMPAI